MDLDGVGKYIVRPMDPMGGGMCWVRPPLRIPVIARINQGVLYGTPPSPCGVGGEVVVEVLVVVIIIY